MLTSCGRMKRAIQPANQKAIGYKGGKDPPRQCKTLSGYKDFRDGGRAMLSREMEKGGPGASRYWLRREMKRVVLDSVGSEKELELEAFRMASGGEANWRVARDDVLQSKLLELLRSWLKAQDLGEKPICYRGGPAPSLGTF